MIFGVLENLENIKCSQESVKSKVKREKCQGMQCILVSVCINKTIINFQSSGVWYAIELMKLEVVVHWLLEENF